MSGMSTHIVGFKPPDEKWKAMKKVWDACLQAGITAPQEVRTFFEGESPDPSGVQVSEGTLRDLGAVRKWSYAQSTGYEVDLTKVPPDVKVLRFFNSW